MSSSFDLTDLLDSYAKGRVSAEERQVLEERMVVDSVLREQVEAHVRLISAVKMHQKRFKLKEKLEKFHQKIKEEDNPIIPIAVNKTSFDGFWKKYLPLTAVAASIALISVLATLMITQGLETKQTANYKELRRNVDQIKKSQKLIMEGIAESKEKSGSNFASYAGTGFLISPNGYVATSYHVVKGADSVYIENEKFGQLKATVYFSDQTNDITILKIASDDFNPGRLPFVVRNIESDLGEYVYTLGFPREDIVFGEGSVSASTGYGQNINAYQISVPVNPGNSGGPLLNNSGDLIGIISGIQTETSGATFAIKSAMLLNLINEVPADSLSKPIVLPRQSTLHRLSRVEQIKKWKEMVFMVRVYNN